MKKIEKIYSPTFGEIYQNKFREKCKNHDITLNLAKSNFNKVTSFLCPMNYINKKSTKITGGKT
jgi:hypothetical protein